MSIYSHSKYYKFYKKFITRLKFSKYKPLCIGNKYPQNGRNNKGHITVWNRGGGSKCLYKRVCFSYKLLNDFILKIWFIDSIIYDGKRSCNIALLWTNMGYFIDRKFSKTYTKKMFKNYFNNFYIYILAGWKMKEGDIMNFFNLKYDLNPRQNQWCQLFNIDTGSLMYNIEFKYFQGGKLARSAGSHAKYIKKFRDYGLIKLPSGNLKFIPLSCFITLGQPSNINNNFRKKYKAGNSRWCGKRPRVRGVATNPVDHPHGGGEGKSSGGRKSVSRWGVLTKGFVTKRKKKKKKKKIVDV